MPARTATGLKVRLSWLKYGLLLFLLMVLNVQVTIFVYHRFHHIDGNQDDKIRQYRDAGGATDASTAAGHGHVIRPLETQAVASLTKIVNSTEHTPQLPKFATDFSEFAFSSLIEREFDSFDLHVTTFLMSHLMLDPSAGPTSVDRVHPDAQEDWNRMIEAASHVEYHPNGMRKQTSQTQYTCRISNFLGGETYTIPAEFLPNRLTADSNSNRLLDILRCKMRDSREAYRSLAGSNRAVQVEMLRGAKLLLAFTVPWSTRRTGFIFAQRSDGSGLHAWQGYRKGSKEAPSSSGAVHLCAAGMMHLPSRRSLPLWLEFISHHLLLGVEHIYLPVTVGWQSRHMDQVIEVLSTYINEGRVTVMSQAGDGIDSVASVGGLTWSRVAMKAFQANTCLFLAKGQAEYVMFQDVDEFFLPAINGRSSIPASLAAAGASRELSPLSADVDILKLAQGWRGGPGLADRDGHPFCYLIGDSHVVLNRHHGTDRATDSFKPFIGDRFLHGAEPADSKAAKNFGYSRVIFPTRRVFQAGLTCAGICLLPAAFTDCKESKGSTSGGFCGDSGSDGRRFNRRSGEGSMLDFRTTHNSYDLTTSADAKRLDPSREGHYYHFLLHKKELSASTDALYNASEYTSRFYPAVHADLRARGLVLLLSLFDGGDPATEEDTEDESWDKLFTPEDLKAAQQQSGAAEVRSAAREFKLRENYSQRASQGLVTLPNFARDFTEFALSALIERVSDSFDLYLTTFFICHVLLEPKLGGSAVSGEKVSPEVIDPWKRAMKHFDHTAYYENGVRKEPPDYRCRIRNTRSSKAYEVDGHFVGNKLTPDSNSNRRLDIFRCKMSDTKEAYLKFARSEREFVMVDILRDGAAILTFEVPWSTRRTGFLYDAPSEASSGPMRDPWRGFNSSSPGEWTHDKLYMCVPGLESTPNKISLPLYLEFVQHHLLLGVDHIVMGLTFSWDSPHMRLFQRIFESYIEEGRVSFVSQTHDNIDLAYTVGGIRWGRDNIKNFQVNMCTYLSKGTADYVGIWDYDEHFWPKGKHSTIPEVIAAMEAPAPLLQEKVHPRGATTAQMAQRWRGGPGLADADGHPFCYLVLDSCVTLYHQMHSSVNPEKPWMGDRFAHGCEPMPHSLGFKKSIRPTRSIFQGGLHLGGACHLPYPWNGCSSPDDQFCYDKSQTQHRLTRFPNGTVVDFNLFHSFNEMVTADKDGKHVDPYSHAVINHLQYHRSWFGASKEALATRSDYAQKHFPKVMTELDRRGLQLPITLPNKKARPFPEPDDQWAEWSSVYSVEEAKATSLSSRNAAAELPENVVLPSFAADGSEYIWDALIERSSGSYDLHLTTFLLSHSMVIPDDDGNTIHKINLQDSSATLWKGAVRSFKEAKYNPDGSRKAEPKFYCAITNSEGDREYTVEGVFMPNRLTPDRNANSRADILRCKIKDSEDAYKTLARHSDKHLKVALLRGSKELIRFSIPWRTRTQGKSLQTTAQSSQLDPWSGYAAATQPSSWKHEKVVMCVPGLENIPTKKGLPVILEFVQHHLLMGVAHLHLTFYFSWDSPHMQRYLRILRSYIEEGVVSVSSHSAIDNIDFVYATHGVSWDRDSVKIFAVNMCLYLNKGMSDYVAVWDVDEFFIPKGSSKSMLDAIRALEPESPLVPASEDWKAVHATGSRGYADGDAHPFCYIMMTSEVIASADESPVYDDSDPSQLWLGNSFSHGVEPPASKVAKQFGFKKQILPTRTIFQAGLHMSGACRVPWQWNGCDDPDVAFCYYSEKRALENRQESTEKKRDQRFNEYVTDRDAKRMHAQEQGSLYHFMLFRTYHVTKSQEVFTVKNDYASKHFPNVLAALRKRNLDLLVIIPDWVPRWNDVTYAWWDYNSVWNARKFVNVSLTKMVV